MKTLNLNVSINSLDYQREILLLTFVEKYIFMAKLQKERIQGASERLQNSVQDRKKSIETVHHQQRILFADLHFFLVAIANIGKTLEKLRKARSYDTDFVKLCKKYVRKIEVLDDFRDSLEHIVDNPMQGLDKKGRLMKSPGDLGNIFGKEFTFGGESFNIPEALKLVDNLSDDLEEWSKDKRSYGKV